MVLLVMLAPLVMAGILHWVRSTLSMVVELRGARTPLCADASRLKWMAKKTSTSCIFRYLRASERREKIPMPMPATKRENAVISAANTMVITVHVAAMIVYFTGNSGA